MGILFSVVALCLTTPALAVNPAGVITVNGEAEIKVIPDRVVLTLGVETSDKSLITAKSLNDEAIKKILRLTKDYQIDSKKVQTDHLTIEPRYNHDYEQKEFLGFFVRNAIVITIEDIAIFDDFLTKSLISGANYVLGIDFQSTQLRKHRDEARKLAIRAAKEKATALAGELGQKIGKPCNIMENGNSWRSWYGSLWNSGWRNLSMQNVIQDASGPVNDSESTVSLGQISIKANVTVTFELE